MLQFLGSVSTGARGAVKAGVCQKVAEQANGVARYLAGFLVIVIALLTIGLAQAAGPSAQFGIRPLNPSADKSTSGYFVLKANPGDTLHDSVVVANPGTIPVSLVLYPVDASTSDAGGAVYLNQTDPRKDVGTWMTLDSSQVDVPPNQQAIVPTSGTVHGGTAITVTGTAFQSGATVTIGGGSATGVTVTSTSITATTAAHIAGAVDVVVTNPDGQTGTLAGAFTYVGALTIATPASDFSYAGTLTGNTLNLSSSTAVTVLDTRGTGAGWNLQGSIGTLTNAGGATIPASGHLISSVATTGVTGVAPTNAITYPRQIPTSTAKVFNSALSTGTGQSTETFTTTLAVPADAAIGTYSTTLTVTIASGP